MGQDLNETDESVAVFRAFVGKITQFNVWTKLSFERQMHAGMSRGCRHIEGKLVSWHKIVDGIHGYVQQINSSECTMPGKFCINII